MDTRWNAQSFPRSSLKKPSHSQSYPTVPSYQGQRLLSVKSERTATVRKNLEVRKLTGNISPTQLQSRDPRKNHAVDDSSDESGAEDEVIIRIDSPSRLSFRQAS